MDPKIYNSQLPDYDRDPPLLAAAKAGQTRVVFALLKMTVVDAGKSDLEGHSVFHILARGGISEAFTEEWLDSDYVIGLTRRPNHRGRTPLYLAARYGYYDIVRDLPQFGSSPMQADEKGDTALCIAAAAGHLEVVRILLAAGSDINVINLSKQYATPLQAAAWSGHLAIVETLLSAGAKVDFATNFGVGSYTALQAAAGAGHLAVVEMLIAAKADVNAPGSGDQDGRTALRVAAKEGHLAVVKRLIKEGAHEGDPRL